jgi:predicted transcriptional regulator
MSTVNTAARTEADAAEHAEDAEALAKWKAANPKKIAAINKATMAMAKAPIEIEHVTEAAIMSLIDSCTAEELEGESVKDMAESIFDGITFEPRRAADLAKRLKKEMKNPAAAFERAREQAQRDEMQDDKDEEKTSCRENGESWSDKKEEWEAEWLENNWMPEEEAEFIVGFEKDWLKDHGTPFPARVEDGPPLSDADLADYVERANVPLKAKMGAEHGHKIDDQLSVEIGDAVKAHDTADATRKEKAIIAGNATTKADLLRRAKDAIEAGDQSLREAADALALAQEDFKAPQREIAEAVGKSAAWVNRLLRWRREGCPGTPFGPGSRAGRERRKRVQSTEQRAPNKIDADTAEARTEKRNTECARPNPNKVNNPLAGFKSAVDWWFPKMDDSAKREAVDYAITKSGMKKSEVKTLYANEGVATQVPAQIGEAA